MSEEDRIKEVVETMQTIKTVAELDELSESARAVRHDQARTEAEKLPEGPEREAAKEQAWVEFAHANRRAHESYMRTMRKLLGEPEQGA